MVIEPSGAVSKPLVSVPILYGYHTRSTPSAAAVHIDRVRGHKFASIGANEQNQFADLLRFAEALHRHIVEELLDQLGRGLRRALKRRFYRPGEIDSARMPCVANSRATPSVIDITAPLAAA